MNATHTAQPQAPVQVLAQAQIPAQAPARAPADPVRVQANYTVTKRLGNWTTAQRFEVRAHRGHAVIDLRSAQIPDGDLVVDVDLDHAMLKLLVADDAVIDDWDLRRIRRGRVKDAQAPKAGRDPRTPRDPNGSRGRLILLTGQMRHGEIRVNRGGIAVLSAMCSREYLADLRRAHEQGGSPTVADPARTS
jgi:hypothetical protein